LKKIHILKQEKLQAPITLSSQLAFSFLFLFLASEFSPFKNHSRPILGQVDQFQPPDPVD